MAPVPDTDRSSSILKSYLSTTLKRAPASASISEAATTVVRKTRELISRDDQPLPDYSSGVTPPDKIDNKAFFALFALIGVGIVITGIWFFFWAKNGGIYFTDHDWEDYKSTVLRRKGPNGTTLSGATESTDLGGGSIYHSETRSIWGRKKKAKQFKDFDEEGSSLSGSQVTNEMTEVPYRDDATVPSSRGEKKKKKAKKSRKDPNIEEEVDISVQEAMRAYRNEKPARVGGINKESEASSWDGSNTHGSEVSSDLLSNRQVTPTTTPTKSRKEKKDNRSSRTPGIRKVMPSTIERPNNQWSRSVADNSTTLHEEEEPGQDLRSETSKPQENGRPARRDFSFRVGDDSVVDPEESRRRSKANAESRRSERRARRESRSPTKRLPPPITESEVGTFVSGESSDLGTKSYHHVIPGLSSTVGSDYAEEKRKRRGGGGYRRERNSIDDDELD
ncbi:hypothetical protein F5884DRAFT_799813 [Xylogone sp. PMI_703]|nr:hypothetical protein F5884DRAFT_799813 [Xylogone sp. PMI_703]